MAEKGPGIIEEKHALHTLTRAASQGDKGAYETLYNAFFPKIARFVAFRISHKETAEDLVADIFVKAWEYLQQSQEINSFGSWIFTIARNKIIDYYRTKKAVTDLVEIENLLHYNDRITEGLDLDFQTKEFLALLPHLSPDQQQVMRLKFFEDLNNDEIGAIMGKTSGTIRVIQHRAIIFLQKRISRRKE